MGAMCMMFGGQDNPGVLSGAEMFCAPAGHGGTLSGAFGKEDAASFLFPTGGGISDLRFTKDSVLGAGEFAQLRMGLSDGVDGTASDLSVLLSPTEDTGLSTVGRIMHVDDEALIRASLQGLGGVSADEYWWSCKFWPDIADEFPMFSTGYDANLVNNATRYIAVAGGVGDDSTEFGGSIVISTPGTFKNLKVWLENATGGGKTFTFTGRKELAAGGGYSDQALTLVATVAGVTSDMSNSFHVAAGDRVSFRSVPNGTPTTGMWKLSVVFVPDTPGLQIIPTSGKQTIDNNSTTFMPVWVGSDENVTSAFISRLGASIENDSELEFTNIYVVHETSPGPPSANRYTYTLRNAAGATGISVAVPDLAANASGSFIVAQNQAIQMRIVPGAKFGAPFATRAMVACTIDTNAPTGRILGGNILGGTIL